LEAAFFAARKARRLAFTVSFVAGMALASFGPLEEIEQAFDCLK